MWLQMDALTAKTQTLTVLGAVSRVYTSVRLGLSLRFVCSVTWRTTMAAKSGFAIRSQPVDFNQVWTTLSDGVKKIVTLTGVKGMPMIEYGCDSARFWIFFMTNFLSCNFCAFLDHVLRFCRDVYKLCIAKPKSYSETLYMHLKELLENHVEQLKQVRSWFFWHDGTPVRVLLTSAVGQHPTSTIDTNKLVLVVFMQGMLEKQGDLLVEYLTQWHAYFTGSTFCNAIFRYLVRRRHLIILADKRTNTQASLTCDTITTQNTTWIKKKLEDSRSRVAGNLAGSSEVYEVQTVRHPPSRVGRLVSVFISDCVVFCLFRARSWRWSYGRLAYLTC
jgi:hypothetical protein